MKLNSRYFGDVEIDESKVITFETTIPGFEGINKYFVITEEGDTAKDDDDHMFCWLHALEDTEVAFALLDVFKVKSDYSPEIAEEYLDSINFSEGDTIAVYNVVNIPDNIKEMTVNLMAPIVLNLTKKYGVQAVLGNSDYSLRHKIFDDVKKKADSGKKVD